MSFVGIEIITDPSGEVRLRQRGYIADVLAHFGVKADRTAEYRSFDLVADFLTEVIQGGKLKKFKIEIGLRSEN